MLCSSDAFIHWPGADCTSAQVALADVSFSAMRTPFESVVSIVFVNVPSILCICLQTLDTRTIAPGEAVMAKGIFTQHTSC